MGKLQPHNRRLEFGKYKGETWGRVGIGYLRWMIKLDPPHSHKAEAMAELDRRGISHSSKDDVDVTGHAIDKASLRRLKVWQEDRKDNEGLHAFLMRRVRECLASGVKPRGQKYKFGGMLLVIDTSAATPVLKTVM